VSTLSADATVTALVGTRVYNAEKVPQASSPTSGTPPPDYISFQFMSGRDSHTIDGQSVLTNTLWTVKAVCSLLVGNGHERARAICEAFEPLLKGKRAVTIGGTVFMAGCRRESVIRYVEPPGNPAFVHRGGVYRCYLDGI
jgi:hypothetical protein